jgi:hypothetical protein
LDSFDAVLLTERLQADVVRLAQLASWYFWDVTRKDALAGDSRPDAGATAAAALPPAEQAELARRTALDAALYAHAGRLASFVRAGAPPLRAPLQRCRELPGGEELVDAAPSLRSTEAAPWGEGWATLGSSEQ